MITTANHTPVANKLIAACNNYVAKDASRPAPQVFHEASGLILLLGGNNSGKSQVLQSLATELSNTHDVYGYTKSQRLRMSMAPLFFNESQLGSGHAMIQHIARQSKHLRYSYDSTCKPSAMLLDGIDESLDDESLIALASYLAKSHGRASYHDQSCCVIATHNRAFVKALLHYTDHMPMTIILGESTQYTRAGEWLYKTIEYPNPWNCTYSVKDMEWVMKQKSKAGLLTWREDTSL